MDLNIYVTEYWVKERMNEVRAAAMRDQLAQSLRARPPLRVTVGQTLVWLGQRLQGDARGPKVLAPGSGAA